MSDDVIWTDEQIYRLNAGQARRDRHPYTCGNNSNHQVLLATKTGWICLDCDYTQGWAHGIQ